MSNHVSVEESSFGVFLNLVYKQGSFWIHHGNRTTFLENHSGTVLQLQAAADSADAWLWFPLWYVLLKDLPSCDLLQTTEFSTRHCLKRFRFWLFHFVFCWSGRETPSVAGIINPGSEGFQKLFFGQEEIAIPVHTAWVLLSLLIYFSYSSYKGKYFQL